MNVGKRDAMETEGMRTPEGSAAVTPAAFAARLRHEPPEALELPDRVTLTGASLEAFLESGHFPFGQYRVGEEQFFVTPSLQIDAAMLERRVQSPAGERIVEDELLVWRRVSFRIAAGTASEERAARPFVGPSGVRAYVWLGRPLPGGPLVLRDANNVEERVPVPEALAQQIEAATPAAAESQAGGATRDEAHRPAGERNGAVHPLTHHPLPGYSPPHPPPAPRIGARSAEPVPVVPSHPVLLRAEQELRNGSPEAAEGHLRTLMIDPGVSGGVLARAGQLWQERGQAEIARAAYTMALERGCIEGALGLSRLAEADGEAIEAAARPLDAAVARNLRSPELHARYAELLDRLGQEAASEWHRHQAEALERIGSREEGTEPFSTSRGRPSHSPLTTHHGSEAP
jgi:hypothetical protein